ncbi:AdoMet-dependent rRNA methyltransferase spb1 [Ascosphaera acerosa]|nr:AdoMet-dependent rRNA methyltransferase spb1 [Ascosphaera acerosa]
MDEELAVQEELQRQRELQKAKKRKERRKENERKQKEIMRMQLHMTTPMEIGLEQDGPFGASSVFNLKTAQKAGDIRKVPAAAMAAESSNDEEEGAEDDDSEYDSEEEEARLERELDTMYARYQADREERDAKARAKRARKDMEDDTFEGFSDRESDDSGDEGEGSGDATGEAAVPSLPRKDGTLSNKAALFFDQDIFNELGDLGVGEEEEDDKPGDDDQAQPDEDEPSDASDASDVEIEGDDDDDDDDESEEEEEEEDDSAEESDNDTKPSSWEASADKEEDPRKKNGQLDVEIITAEAMALAQSIATGEKSAAEVVDDAFNRYSFRDVDNLPEWFLDDEGKHSKLQKPISAAAAAAIREKLRAINARPIKKVLEAKGRKKMKAAQRLEKLKRKSALLADDETVSEKDKAQTIARMMSRALKKKPKQKVKLVVARGGNKGISGRPRGVKGKYKIVDARLKKDIRAQKRAAKKHKR